MIPAILCFVVLFILQYSISWYYDSRLLHTNREGDNKPMKKWAILIGLSASLLGGCAATELAGQAIRSGIKDIEFNVTNGYNIQNFTNR